MSETQCGNAHNSATFAVIAMLALAVVIAGWRSAHADDIAEGQRIWANKAGCQDCHGWAGDGVGSFHAPKGASLRNTQLDRNSIRLTIQCGRPGTPMPYFDRFAYTDKRCYGMTAAEVGDAMMPNRSPTTLQTYEIDALADYVAQKIKGAGPVTRGQCTEYFGHAAARCDAYPEK